MKTNKQIRAYMARRTGSALLALTLLLSVAILPISALEPNGTGLVVRDWLTNDPEYTFSDKYQTSVFYENFSALSLGKNHRNNVLQIAMSQLGYHEGNSAADFDGKNQSGSNNYIEYARLLCPWYNNNSYEWCACFVNWCLNQAGIDYAYGEISCINWVRWLKANNMFEHSPAYGGTYTPQPADFIFFSWNSVNTTASHIGFVLYTTDTHVYTIEGNTSDQVGLRSYPLNDTRIIGYGAPPYVVEDEPTISYKPQDIWYPGLYMLNTAKGTNIRLYKEQSKTNYTAISNGTMVEVKTRTSTESQWLTVTYGDQTGYIANDGTTTISLLSPARYRLEYVSDDGNTVPDPQYGFCFSTITVASEVPTKEDAEFIGWSLDPDATEQDELIRPGDPILLKLETATLYAIWKDIPVETQAGDHPETSKTESSRPNQTETSAPTTSTTTEQDSNNAWTTTVYVPENLTSITGGTDRSGCQSIIQATFSILMPISLAALLAWKKKRDSKEDQDS